MEKYSPIGSVINNEEGSDSVSALPDIVFSEMNFAAFVETAKVGMFVSQDDRLLYVNAALAAQTGRQPADLIGKRIDEVLLLDDPDEFWHRVTITQTGQVKSLSFPGKVLHRAGHVVDVEMHGTRVECRGRDASFGVAIDVSEQLRREREIRESREQLRELTAYINTVREQQRARMSREIHDVLGGMLTSIKMDAERILRRAESIEMIEITEGLIDLVQETIDAAREMSEKLHPGELEHLGLKAALDRQLYLHAKRQGMTYKLVMPERDILLSRDQAIAAYRIFQEALTNISRHADATHVEVCLTVDGRQFEMSISDNGRGIDPEFVRDNAMGILGMKERAREAGGMVVMESPPCGGTCLRLNLKIAAEDTEDD